MAILNVASRFSENSKNFTRNVLHLENGSFKKNVNFLTEEISKSLSVPTNSFDVIFMGRCLNPEDSLESVGLQPGMTVFALPKASSSEGSQPIDTTTHDRLKYQVASLRLTFLNSAFRNMVQLLHKPEVMNKFYAALPELYHDPVALAILQDPEMLIMLSRNDSTNIRKLVELHPVIVNVVQMIEAEYETYCKSNDVPAPTPNVSYYIDSLSDDEDMDSSREQDLSAAAMAAAGLPGLMGPPAPITPSQLASALASVERDEGSSSSARGSRLSSSLASPSQIQTPPSTPRTLITNEMFSSAVEQVLGSMIPPSNNWQSQMQQLRDMGITDDSVSQRALEVTGGDVHAALELIFGDLSEPSDL